MNKTLAILLVGIVALLFAENVSAQNPDSISNPTDFYLNISSGIDNYTGILGVGAFVPFNDQIGLRFGVGIGGWGSKISAGVKFQNLQESGVGFGIGYSRCSGLEAFDLEIRDRSGNTKTVNMDFKPVGSLNLTINKNWIIGRGNVLYIESGYAIATGGIDFYEVNDGSTLNDDEELLLNIMRPGGLVLSIGIFIAL